VELAANRDYWGPKAAYDIAVFRAIPEATTRVAELLAGNVDIVTDVPPELAGAVRTRGTLKLEPVQSTRVMYVGMNTQRKPLDNLKVRQALNHAIDKQALVDKAMSGYATKNIGILSPRSFGYNPKVSDRYPYDVARARQLLAEAGVGGGFEVSFDLGRRYFRDREVAQAIAGYLGAVGVRTRINEMEWGTFVVAWTAGKTEGFWYHGFADMTGDADLPLYYFFSTAGQISRYYYFDKQIADLVDRGRTSLDPRVRLTAYEQASERIVDQAPMIWLFSLNNAYGVRNEVNWTPRPDERVLPYEAKQSY
jgi:peptide/nickel transport system substrate-binding protein